MLNCIVNGQPVSFGLCLIDCVTLACRVNRANRHRFSSASITQSVLCVCKIFFYLSSALIFFFIRVPSIDYLFELFYYVCLFRRSNGSFSCQSLKLITRFYWPVSFSVPQGCCRRIGGRFRIESPSGFDRHWCRASRSDRSCYLFWIQGKGVDGFSCLAHLNSLCENCRQFSKFFWNTRNYSGMISARPLISSSNHEMHERESILRQE